ncbi:MAG: ParB/RepB/Spo0J family partition protein [Candidatus Hydrogenedentota bacterium]|nr:MAG: ParB/RepB/Spo0J family partition protein [Candidatus Hydrogenedentota bacterium]
MAKAKKRALGRGLSNLIEVTPEQEAAGVQEIPIEKIRVNPDNPRKKFDTVSIKELAATIREHGLLQPILVQPIENGYMVISGERRLRACRELKLKTVPCLVKEVDKKTKLEISLIENIQREQLDAIEEATVYKTLLTEYKLTQSEIADRVGKSRSAIANRLRLLTLPEMAQAAIADGRLSEGQVRPVIGIKNPKVQASLVREILSKGLSARQVESLAKKYTGSKVKDSKTKKVKKEDSNIKEMEKKLETLLNTRVSIKHNASKNAGKIVIDYFTLDDFDRILSRLLGKNKI